MIFHEIVCWQTILMKYHTLFFLDIVAKFVVCCSRDWPFKSQRFFCFSSGWHLFSRVELFDNFSRGLYKNLWVKLFWFWANSSGNIFSIFSSGGHLVLQSGFGRGPKLRRIICVKLFQIWANLKMSLFWFFISQSTFLYCQEGSTGFERAGCFA